MSRVATIALIVASVASFACAQRSASRGGFSGHSGPSFHGAVGRSAPAFHGGFTGSAPSRLAGPPRYGLGAQPGSSFSRPLQYPHSAQGFARSAPSNFYAQSGSADRFRHRMPYRSPYNRGDRDFDRFHPAWSSLYNPYLYSPYFLGYPDYFDYLQDEDNGTPAAQGYLSPGYDSQPPDQGQQEPPPWPSYNPPPPAAVPASKTGAPESAESVTIVFNDGRPPEQIHNYLITPTTLYILDKQRHEIPIDHIDLIASAKANHDAGVDFSLPGPSR